MKSETMFDRIILRRLSFEEIEMFDLIIDEEGYKRVVITHYQDQNQVVVTTNLMELDTPKLFDVEGTSLPNDALIIQSRIIFNSFIVDEDDGSDFDLTIGVIDDKDIKEHLKEFEDAQKKVGKYVEKYLEDHEELDEDIFELDEFLELNEMVNERSNVLDNIFLEDEVLDYLESDPENYLKYS